MTVLAALALTGCSPGRPAAPAPQNTGPGASVVPGVSSSPSASPGNLLLSPVPQPPPVAVIEAPGVAQTGPGGSPLADAPGGRTTGRLRAGVPVPVSAVESEWAKIMTPCELARWVPVSSLAALGPFQVVLDPGHGGAETGAVGPAGLAEKTVNLGVARKAAATLQRSGISALLTRAEDYRATLAFRSAIAAAARPAILVSIHHNAEPDGKMDRPGSETFYQIGSLSSKRLAGLMYEEAIRALSPLGAAWVGDSDAGAKWRPNSRGGDYYGILRLAKQADITAILAELAFISNPSEEELLAREDVLALEADAVARAITRYLRSQDPGSGFTTPYPREAPAGPGGGRGGCIDPS